MPTIETAAGSVTFCVLIPSRGRADLLAKSLKKMPWLDDPDTLIGYEEREAKTYRAALGKFLRTSRRVYDNPQGSVAVAREFLRRSSVAASPIRHFDFFVVTDDNAIHRSKEALHNLVRATAEWKIQPCVMAGMHNTAAHFDRTKIASAVTRRGLRSYPTVAAIFQCYPLELYKAYAYPEMAFGLDDRHFFLWCLSQGMAEFRVCMDAPFTKSRYQPGGQGTLDERAEKCGRAIERLAHDFPKFVGATGTLRLPWTHLIESVRQGGHITGNRLTGGAMRKEGALQPKRLTIKRKRT